MKWLWRFIVILPFFNRHAYHEHPTAVTSKNDPAAVGPPKNDPAVEPPVVIAWWHPSWPLAGSHQEVSNQNISQFVSDFFGYCTPSGNLFHSYWKWPLKLWVFPWIAWWFSIAILVYHRVSCYFIVISYCIPFGQLTYGNSYIVPEWFGFIPFYYAVLPNSFANSASLPKAVLHA